MSSTVTPSNQTVYLDPYSAKLFDFNSVDSRVYLSRAINNLYKAAGDNCILDGLKVTNTNMTANVATVTLSPGKAIVDSTLIEFTDPITLDLDVAGYSDAEGFLITNLSYQFLHTVYSNLSKVKLSYVVNDGSSVYPANTWFTNRDKLITGILAFDKNTQTITDITPGPGDPPLTKTILGQTFNIPEPDYATKRVHEAFGAIAEGSGSLGAGSGGCGGSSAPPVDPGDGGGGTPVSAPTISLVPPSVIEANVPAQLDVTIIDDGGDAGVTYSWEVSIDDGSSWSVVGLSDPNTKNPQWVVLSDGLSCKARVTVTNDGGGNMDTMSASITSDPEPTGITAPSGLSVSAPSGTIDVNVATPLDVTVANDGNDPSFTYLWEVSIDGGSTWDNDGLLSSTIVRDPNLTITADGLSCQVRVTVTNSGGSANASSGIFTSQINITADTNSSVTITAAHLFPNTEHAITGINGTTFNVSGSPFAVGDEVRLVNGNIDTVASVASDGGSGQDVVMENGPVTTGIATNLSSVYDITPQIEQEGGEDPFVQMDLDVQFDRHKFPVTESSGNIVIDHGSVPRKPFKNGDAVVVSGATDVVTTVSVPPVHSSVVGTGDVLYGPDIDPPDFGPTGYSKTCKLADNKILYVKSKTAGPETDSLMMIVGEVSGDNIVWGVKQELFTPSLTSGDNFMIGYAGPNRALIGYANKTKIAIVTADGTVLTPHADSTLSSNTEFVYLGNDKILVGYFTGSTESNMICTIESDNTITLGTEQSIAGSRPTSPKYKYLGNNKVLFLGTVNQSRAERYCFGTVDFINNQVSWGPCEDGINNSTNKYGSGFTVIGTTIVHAFVGQDSGNNHGTGGYYNIGTIDLNNDTITWANPADPTFSVPNNAYWDDTFDVAQIGGKVAVVYGNTPGNYAFEVFEGTVTGTTVSWTIGLSKNVGLDQLIVELTPGVSVLTYGFSTSFSSNVITYDGSNYTTTLTTADALPTSPTSVDLLPLTLEGDLSSGVKVLQNLNETYEVVDANKARVTASLTGDSGMFADIRIKADNTDLNEANATRIQADFSV